MGVASEEQLLVSSDGSPRFVCGLQRIFMALPSLPPFKMWRRPIALRCAPSSLKSAGQITLPVGVEESEKRQRTNSNAAATAVDTFHRCGSIVVSAANVKQIYEEASRAATPMEYVTTIALAALTDSNLRQASIMVVARIQTDASPPGSAHTTAAASSATPTHVRPAAWSVVGQRPSHRWLTDWPLEGHRMEMKNRFAQKTSNMDQLRILVLHRRHLCPSAW